MNSYYDYVNFAEHTKTILQIIGLLSALIAFTKIDFSNRNYSLSILIGLFIVLVFRIGFQPIGFGLYCDRELYAISFINTGNLEIDFSHDWFLGIINYFLHPLCDVETYFIIIGCIYVGLYFFAALRLSKYNSYWILISIILSIGFVSYGYNTLRAGIAIALILVGITFNKRIWIMAVFFFLGIGTHFSMIIPISAFVFSHYWPKTKVFFYLWLFSIPLSFVAGGYFNVLFSSLSTDSRTNYLTTLNDYYNIGFKLDFIIYSLVPFAVGWYYIFKKKFTDRMYVNMYNTYILANIFWILVIRSNFSDRFAYLSWFLLPIILVYPLLNGVEVKRPRTWLGSILLGEVLFNFFV